MASENGLKFEIPSEVIEASREARRLRAEAERLRTEAESAWTVYLEADREAGKLWSQFHARLNAQIDELARPSEETP